MTSAQAVSASAIVFALTKKVNEYSPIWCAAQLHVGAAASEIIHKSFFALVEQHMAVGGLFGTRLCHHACLRVVKMATPGVDFPNSRRRLLRTPLTNDHDVGCDMLKTAEHIPKGLSRRLFESQDLENKIAKPKVRTVTGQFRIDDLKVEKPVAFQPDRLGLFAVRIQQPSQEREDFIPVEWPHLENIADLLGETIDGPSQ